LANDTLKPSRQVDCREERWHARLLRKKRGVDAGNQRALLRD